MKKDTATAVQLAKDTKVMLARNNNKAATDIRRSDNENRISAGRNQRNAGQGPVIGIPTNAGQGPVLGIPTSRNSAGNSGSGKLRLGAPLPSRYVVIARVRNDVAVEDVTSYINDKDSSVEIRSL